MPMLSLDGAEPIDVAEIVHMRPIIDLPNDTPYATKRPYKHRYYRITYRDGRQHWRRDATWRHGSIDDHVELIGGEHFDGDEHEDERAWVLSECRVT